MEKVKIVLLQLSSSGNRFFVSVRCPSSLLTITSP